MIEATGNDNITILLGDLANQQDIRSIASDFLATDKPLHVLLNNAGITNMKRELTVDGYEAMFAVNHLAYFLLTNLLLDCLKSSAPARIVNVASGAHSFVKDGLNVDDLNYEQGFSSMKVYGHSKLANILFTRELSQRLIDTDVTVNALHPGAVGTGLGAQNGWLGKAVTGMLKPFFRKPEKGAETAIYLATSTEVEGKTGGYYYDCQAKQPKPWAKDAAMAKKLWDKSAEMTGLAQ
ncbi:MAG: SDR family NAD(P)-dependent oxidoreductase [Pseudomonadales bacterium]